MNRMIRGDHVRRWDEYGRVVASSTHYAIVEWDTDRFEEVEQLDPSIEVTRDGDSSVWIEEEIQVLEESLEKLEARPLGEDETEDERSEAVVRLVERIDDLEDDLEDALGGEYERDHRYMLWSATQPVYLTGPLVVEEVERSEAA